MSKHGFRADDLSSSCAGIPFGLYADMLGPARTHANALRGMLFGMLPRAGWEGSLPKQNAALWRMWDAFGLDAAGMKGWWSDDCPARTAEPRVVATVYLRMGLRALIAVGSWLRREWRGDLHLNWTRLGMEPADARIEILDAWGQVQRPDVKAQELGGLVVPARDGVLLRIFRRGRRIPG